MSGARLNELLGGRNSTSLSKGKNQTFSLSHRTCSSSNGCDSFSTPSTTALPTVLDVTITTGSSGEHYLNIVTGVCRLSDGCQEKYQVPSSDPAYAHYGISTKFRTGTLQQSVPVQGIPSVSKCAAGPGVCASLWKSRIYGWNLSLTGTCMSLKNVVTKALPEDFIQFYGIF